MASAGKVEKTILFGGDTHFGENYQEGRSENVLKFKGYDFTIEKFSAQLRAADAVIVNLETPITDLNSSTLSGKPYLHHADPIKTPAHLLKYNISVVSLGNNHVFDFGQPGFSQTIDTLEAYGFEWFGAGLNASEAARPYLQKFQIANRTFTLGVIGAFEFRRSYDEHYEFYANATKPGCNTLSIEDIGKQLIAMKDADPNVFIVAFPHWGDNYAFKTDEQTEIGHGLIDSGVDMVIGHGAHMLQEVELYHDRWIVYSLGNLVFNSNGRYAENNAPPYSLILEMVISENGFALEGVLRLYPTFTNNLVTGFQSRYVNRTEFQEVKSLLLSHGGNGSWDGLYAIGENDNGNHYLEFPLLDGNVRTEFFYDNFEDGTAGSYTLGSSTDANLKIKSEHCPAGSCIRLEDGRGIKSSFFTSGTFNASGQDRIEIDYWMHHRWGEVGDAYYVKYWDGKTWHTVATFYYKEDFVHDSMQNRVVTVDGTDYVMSCQAKVSFESAGSDDSDDFYFDQIRVKGVVSPNGPRKVYNDCSGGNLLTASNLIILIIIAFWLWTIA
jgi:hypothetical protein